MPLVKNACFCSLSFHGYMTRYVLLYQMTAQTDSMHAIAACLWPVPQHANACKTVSLVGSWQILHAHDIVCDCCRRAALFVGGLYV
jgi:hypothetical protein